MIRFALVSSIFAFSTQLPIPSMADEDAKASVVKISVTTRNPDFSHPWNKANPTEASGTGFIIDGTRIVTNAHVVRYASQVYVQPDQSDEKFEATVVAISYGLDRFSQNVAENGESIRQNISTCTIETRRKDMQHTVFSPERT